LVICIYRCFDRSDRHCYGVAIFLSPNTTSLEMTGDDVKTAAPVRALQEQSLALKQLSSVHHEFSIARPCFSNCGTDRRSTFGIRISTVFNTYVGSTKYKTIFEYIKARLYNADLPFALSSFGRVWPTLLCVAILFVPTRRALR